MRSLAVPSFARPWHDGGHWHSWHSGPAGLVPASRRASMRTSPLHLGVMKRRHCRCSWGQTAQTVPFHTGSLVPAPLLRPVSSLLSACVVQSVAVVHLPRLASARFVYSAAASVSVNSSRVSTIEFPCMLLQRCAFVTRSAIADAVTPYRPRGGTSSSSTSSRSSMYYEIHGDRVGTALETLRSSSRPGPFRPSMASQDSVMASGVCAST
jgi:hypothetical protein